MATAILISVSQPIATLLLSDDTVLLSVVSQQEGGLQLRAFRFEKIS